MERIYFGMLKIGDEFLANNGVWYTKTSETEAEPIVTRRFAEGVMVKVGDAYFNDNTSSRQEMVEGI